MNIATIAENCYHIVMHIHAIIKVGSDQAANGGNQSNIWTGRKNFFQFFFTPEKK
jgi:hypothetical protein